MKVGGRRLSISSRPKPHPPVEATPASPTGEDAADYPRPTAPGDQAVHHEEEVPKKEKKGNGGDEHERRLQENPYRKAEQNRPSKDAHGAKNMGGVGGGGRISQPVSRMGF